MFCQQWWDLLAHLFCLVGDMRCAQTLQYSWSWSRGEAEHVTTQKSEGKLTNKIRRDNLTIAKYLEAAEAWYFPD